MSVVELPVRTRSPDTGPGPELQFRTVHGYRRAFIMTGRGPAVLLIHGIGDRSDTWRDIIPALARDHTVIAPDLLGHGQSDKPRADYSIAAYANAMRDLLNVVGIDRATIVGHSLGGGVAMQFAYQFPEVVERLVLISTGGVRPEVHPVLRAMSAPNADLFLPLLGLSVTRVLGRGALGLLRAFGTNLGLDATHLGRVFDAFPEATARRAFVRTLRSAVDWRGQAITMLDRSYLARGLPTLLVWGGRDAVIPVRHGHIAHEAMSDSRLVVFENAGHFPHRHEPERFVEILLAFLAETEPREHDREAWRELIRKGPAAELPALSAPDAPALLTTA